MMHGHMRTLLLGDASVDLICERPVAALGDADAFVPHVGGAAAAVAALAAGRGAEVALAAAVGDDDWGRWIAQRLHGAGVRLEHLSRAEGPTAIGFVTVGEHGAPVTTPHGDPPAIPDERAVGEAVAAAGALVFTSSAIASATGRAVTAAARAAALQDGKPVVLHADLRPHRWETPATWATAARELVKDTFLVTAGTEEARLLTGEDVPAAAAEGLVAMGATHAVVGHAGGAVVRGGGVKLDVTGRPGPVTSRLGEQDALCAVVLAQLEATAFYGPAIAAALPEAVAAAAAATERWGALA